MSITFGSNATGYTSTAKLEPCLCAQFAQCFGDVLHGNMVTAQQRAELASQAHPDCYSCKGTGLETVETSNAPQVNFANTNAMDLLRAMGRVCPDCYGEMTLADARRGIMRALNRSDLSAFTREDEIAFGAPRDEEDGTVELKPVRMMSRGSSVADVKRRIADFQAFVEEVASRGATTITWG